MIPVTIHRLTIEDAYKMVETGVLDEDDRIELVEGVLVDMVPIGAEHDGATAWLTSHFARVETDRWQVRVQSALLVAGGLPGGHDLRRRRRDQAAARRRTGGR